MDEAQDCPVVYDSDGISVDKDAGVIGLNWGGYDYWVYLDLIQSKDDLSHWLMHLSRKCWRDVSAYRVARFGVLVSQLKGWEVVA